VGGGTVGIVDIVAIPGEGYGNVFIGGIDGSAAERTPTAAKYMLKVSSHFMARLLICHLERFPDLSGNR
jgi:hypothetical protein